MKYKSLVAGIVLASSSSVAFADQFYIDVGTDFGGNANKAAGATTTGWFDEMLYEYSSNTLVTDTDGNGPDAGDLITTTGGFTDGSPGSLTTNAVKGFSPSEVFGTGPSENGFGDWGLTFQFELSGSLGPALTTNYNAGEIKFFYFDATLFADTSTYVELFTIDVVSTFNSFGGPSIRGIVSSYGTDLLPSGTAAGDVLNFAEGTLEELVDDMVDVFANVDFNTDPSQITTVNNLDGTFTLTGEHDGSISFQIPEPASIAVLGLGLLGLAGAGRRRKS